MITLTSVPFVTNALVRKGMYSGPLASRTTGGPEGLLARCVGFKGAGSMYAHRYNGQPDGTNMAPPVSAGKFDGTIPATAIYVVWSFATPIAWVDEDGTVTIPDQRYSVTTTIQQNQCRAWLGAAVPGTTTNTHHVAEGYRVSADKEGLGVGHVWTNVGCPAYASRNPLDCTCNG